MRFIKSAQLSSQVLDARAESCALLLEEYPKLQSVLTDPPSMIDERTRFVILVVHPTNTKDIERVRSRVWCNRDIERYRNSPNKVGKKRLADASPDVLIRLTEDFSPSDAERAAIIDGGDD